MIRVLIVEDSPVVREFLVHILESDPALKVVAIANNGEEALEAVKRYKPDVITMDIYMPRMDGFEATRQIMATQPTPIVIVSGSSRVKEVAFSFRGIEAGALAVVGRPAGINNDEFDSSAKELVQTVKLMSEIKVVRRWNRIKKDKSTAGALLTDIRLKEAPAEIQAVAMGASTGGPLALQTILCGLPKDFPVPVLIVQHIVPGFIPGFVDWLAGSSAFPVKVAADFEYAVPGHAYVAPDGVQMALKRGNQIRLVKDEAIQGLCPSVGYLFRSVADALEQNAIGVLLTGMGTDGARELKIMKDKLALTIAQDEESSVIHGMPGEAIRIGAVTYVLPLSRIGPALVTLTKRRS
jgi:two-component system, chemotaxis family, protein-glutamate methylesterase/glutaminase